MPVYEVTSPDGKTWEVTAPDGATQAQVLEFAKAQWSTQKPAAPMSRGEKFAQGMRDPIEGGAQLLTHVLPEGVVNAGNRLNNWLADKTGLVAKLPEGGVDQQVRETNAAYDARRKEAGETGVDWTRLAGNVFNPVNLALAAKIPQAATLLGKIGIGATAGGLTSTLNPVTGDDYAKEKAKQIAIGAAAGGAAPLVVGGLSRVISPKASTDPALQLLKQENVTPTIGQTLGGRFNALEEKMMSVPVVGDAIANARGRALEQFNKAAIARATDPVAGKVEGVGQQAVKEAGDLIGQAYDDALSQLKFIRFDQKFAQDAAQLKSMAQGLTPPMRSKFERLYNDVLGGRVSTSGTMLAETVKKVDSELGQMASRYGRSSVASEQELADATKQLQALLREQVARSSPQASASLKAADKGYANLVRVEGAAKAAKNNEGVFTPAQLNMAIQMADNSVRKRAVSRGTALMQDLGSAGQKVLGNKVPNSGTAERLMYGGGALGGGFMINPAIPAGLLAGAAAYTPPAQALLRAAVSSRPQLAEPVAEMLYGASPALGPALGLLGLEVVK